MAIDTRRHDCPARFIPTRQSRLRSLTLKGRLTATCDAGARGVPVVSGFG